MAIAVARASLIGWIFLASIVLRGLTTTTCASDERPFTFTVHTFTLTTSSRNAFDFPMYFTRTRSQPPASYS